jgi:hypothetical protein
MPTRDQVIQVPFVGGIDEYTDPDQLQPPGMAALENAVVRKTGRIEKREGFQYLEKPNLPGTPVDAFGGSSGPISESVEALGVNSGKDGSRLLLAANNTLFEYVGSDDTHGFRDVNRLPSCYGTLHPIDATGGEITEVESALNDDGTLRCTVWVLGARNGQDLTNDSAINEQPISTHGLYVAVQKTADGSFVAPPTRVQLSGGGVLKQVCDLRMGLVPVDGALRKDWVVAYRREYSAIDAFSVNSSIGTVHAPQLLLGFASRPYHRSFDFTSVPGEGRALFAFCDAQSTVSNEDIQLRTCAVSPVGLFTLGGTYPLITSLSATGFVGGVYTWSGYKARGVVLETSPASASAIGVGARLVYQSTSVPTKLDGKMIVSKVNVIAGATPAADAITVVANQYGVLHRIGFKTDESLTGSFAGAGARFYSSSVTMAADIRNPSSLASPLFPYSYLTGEFTDGTVEVYQASAAQAFGRAYTGLVPYKAAELQNITAAGYVKSPHVYDGITRFATIEQPLPAAAPIPTGGVKINKQQVTNIQIDTNHGIPAAEGWVITGNMIRGGAVWCVAQIYCEVATGHFKEVAIVDGNPGNPFAVLTIGVGFQADSFQVTSAVNINSTSPSPAGFTYAINAAGANHRMFDLLNSPNAYLAQSVGTDVADQTRQVTQTWFDSTIAPEPCVHRWDVCVSQANVILAMSSTSAAVMSNPNGDVPLGYVSPFAENNYFEVYEYPNGLASYALNDYAGGSRATIWTALGGPWRLISSVVKLAAGRLACVLAPSGDDYQRSAFLVSFARPASLGVVSTPKPTSGGALAPATADGYTYTGNAGVFVESLNMARIAAIPLNCPRLTALSTGEKATYGAIRQGQNVGGSEVFSIDYTFQPGSWRKMQEWGDYTVVNGGVLSAYDGSSCNEAAMLLWPQRDLTSIAYERVPTKLFLITQNTTQPYAGVIGGPDSYFTLNTNTSYLKNITDPWFAYKAGFKNAYGTSSANNVDMAWGYMSTFWGGKGTEDYQVVYSDPRILQVSAVSRPAASAGLNEASTQHYYGRYQSGYSTGEISTIYNERMVIWAPRSAPGVATPQASDFVPLVANGDFMVRWCYESVDGTGRVVRSAPSQAATFSVCCRIRYDVDQYGGVVDEYRYGFFAPRLELTNRLKTAESDSKRVVLQPYFTAEPFATVFYKTPFSNFLPEYNTAFTVPRNATRGVVPYSGTPASAGGQLGLVTNNFGCLDGPQGDYNGLLTQPVLYTVGGGLDNVAPPSALCMTVHQNRLVLGGADDATVVWFSKELSSTDAPGFNDALTIQIEDGGAVTGLASLESLLIIFKRGMTWLVPGDMPDDTGSSINRGYVSNTLGTPVRMPHGIGCVDHRSVIETPVGVFFKSERTIELLSRDMSITPVGLKLDDTLSAYTEVTSAIHNAKDTEVWFALRDPNNVTSTVFAVYNYTTDVWSKHNVDADSYSPPTLPMTIMDNNVYFATNWADPLGLQPIQTVVYKQTENKFFDVTPEGRKYVVMSGVTAPISMNNVQGYQRVKRVRLIGSPIPTKSTGAPQSRNPHGMQVGAFTDYALTGPNNGFQLAQWSEAESAAVYADQNREVYEVHVKEQKGQKITVAFAETAPADINSLSHGYGTAFSNLAIVVGLKAGLDKRITPGAKH